MRQETTRGIIAGAVGTVALNVATYADMALRGRPSSGATARLIDTLGHQIGLSLPAQGTGDQKVQNRESGLGALLGFVNGLSTGIAYGLLRSRVDSVPIPLAALGVGLTAMVASDVPLVALGVSNPKTWGLSGWLADLIPHLIFGLATVTTYETLLKQE